MAPPGPLTFGYSSFRLRNMDGRERIQAKADRHLNRYPEHSASSFIT
jgi:hypothetical protein